MEATLDQELLADLRTDLERREGQFAEVKRFLLWHNNSGGYWWLSADDWADLEVAGFTVEHRDGGRLPIHATVTAHSEIEAKALFEKALNWKFSADEQGCPCCGMPFDFREIEEWEADEWR